jgi:hypothetical protein
LNSALNQRHLLSLSVELTRLPLLAPKLEHHCPSLQIILCSSFAAELTARVAELEAAAGKPKPQQVAAEPYAEPYVEPYMEPLVEAHADFFVNTFVEPFEVRFVEPSEELPVEPSVELPEVKF